MMEPDAGPTHATSARTLTGRVAEWGELLGAFREEYGLTVVVSDPWSGTTALLENASREISPHPVLVDARRCADMLDLAMAIADAAIAAAVPGASAWWLGNAPPNSSQGLRFWRSIRATGIDPDALRDGQGTGEQRLRDSVDLLLSLSDGPASLAVDHLGRMLASMRTHEARETLEVMRSLRQQHHRLNLLLVDHPGGPIATALSDEDHPLYRAGQTLRFRRPTPDRVVGDLTVLRPSIDAPIELLRSAADLAAGVPELTWKTVDLAPRSGRDAGSRALAGWNALRRFSEGSVRREWDLLRRVHGSAQAVVAAVSVGHRPHTVPAASKSIYDALNRLRDVGLAWQPEERAWALADPLLSAWARDNAPPWLVRRSGYARRRESGAPLA
jgi:hypothetical protein